MIVFGSGKRSQHRFLVCNLLVDNLSCETDTQGLGKAFWGAMR